MTPTLHEVTVRDLARISFPEGCATCGAARPVVSVAVKAELAGRDTLLGSLFGLLMGLMIFNVAEGWPPEAVLLAAMAVWLTLWSAIICGARPEVDVPVCATCAANVWRRRRRTEVLIRTFSGLTLAAMLLGARIWFPNVESRTVIVWAALSTVPWNAAIMIRRRIRPDPVMLRLEQRSATFRFANKPYADQFAWASWVASRAG